MCHANERTRAWFIDRPLSSSFSSSSQVLSAMFCGVAPRLPELEDMGAAAVGLTWASADRW